MRPEAVVAVTAMVPVLWCVTPYSLVDKVPKYTAEYSVRQYDVNYL